MIPQAVVASSNMAPQAMPYMAPVGYPPFYGQYPPGAPTKPGEGPIYYPQFYLTPMPAPTHAPPPHEGEANGYASPMHGHPHAHAHAHPQAQFYPTFVAAPYAQPYPPQYVMHPSHPHPHAHAHAHARADMPMAITNGQHRYTPYPQVYPKPPLRGAGAPPTNGAPNGFEMMAVPLEAQGRGGREGAGPEPAQGRMEVMPGGPSKN